MNRAVWCFALPSVAFGADPSWNEIKKLELTYQALSAVDAVQTLHCLHQHNCYEINPLLGKHPSTAEMVGTKVVFGALHYYVIKSIYQEHPKLARNLEYFSIAAQGSIIALNLRYTF